MARIFGLLTLSSLLFFLLNHAVASSMPSNNPCKTTTYILLPNSDVAVYNESLHGSDKTLRLFDLMPSKTCYARRSSKVSQSTSTRTDIQVRDPRTDLVERGFLDRAKSALKWSPIAFLGGALSLGKCFFDIFGSKENHPTLGDDAFCIAGAVLTLLGVSYPVFNAVSKGLQALGAFGPQEVVNVANMQIDLTELFRKRDGGNSSLSPIIAPYLFHAHDNTPVSLAHIAGSNLSHPLTIYHRGVLNTTQQMVTLWHELNPATNGSRIHTTTSLYGRNQTANSETAKRQDCYPETGIELEDNPDVYECGTASGPVDGGPSGAYYGFDLYGSDSDFSEFDDDLGLTYVTSNGFIDGVIDMSNDIANTNAWDTCVCQQTAGSDWIATGSIQYTWEGGYNGYSPCWNTNCDGA